MRTIRLFSPPANQPYKEWLAKENKRWSEQVRRFQSCSSLSVEVRFAKQDVSVTPGWSLGWVSALDLEGQTIWIVGTHCDDGQRFIVRADES